MIESDISSEDVKLLTDIYDTSCWTLLIKDNPTPPILIKTLQSLISI